jgi:hypothetical protein
VSFSIRKVAPADARAISEIASEHMTSPQSLPRNGDNGFLMVPVSEEDYVRQIEVFTHGYVAEKDGRIAGYFLGSTVENIQKFYEGKMAPGTIADVMATCAPDDVYIFQVAAGKKNQRQGVLRNIFDYFNEHVEKNARLLAHIVHVPVKNTASIQLFKGQGYALISELTYDGWTLGLYEKRS